MLFFSHEGTSTSAGDMTTGETTDVCELRTWNQGTSMPPWCIGETLSTFFVQEMN